MPSRDTKRKLPNEFLVLAYLPSFNFLFFLFSTIEARTQVPGDHAMKANILPLRFCRGLPISWELRHEATLFPPSHKRSKGH